MFCEFDIFKKLSRYQIRARFSFPPLAQIYQAVAGAVFAAVLSNRRVRELLFLVRRRARNASWFGLDRCAKERERECAPRRAQVAASPAHLLHVSMVCGGCLALPHLAVDVGGSGGGDR